MIEILTKPNSQRFVGVINIGENTEYEDEDNIGERYKVKPPTNMEYL